MQTPTPPAPYELVTIELAGRQFTLFASFYAIKRIKEQTGVDLRDPATYTAWESDHLPLMLFELLQHQEGALSLEEIERAFDCRQADQVAEKIFETVGVDIHALTELVEGVADAQARGEDPLAYARGMRARRKSRGRRRRS